MRVAVTGHRPNKLGNEYDGIGPISDRLRWKMRSILLFPLGPDEPAKVTQAISGMALGVDMLWAEVALELNIPLLAAIPFVGQEMVWPPKSQRRYHHILGSPGVLVHDVSKPGYAAWKMQARNKWMVDHCDLLVAFWNKAPGGTAACVEYAKQAGRDLVIFNPEEL